VKPTVQLLRVLLLVMLMSAVKPPAHSFVFVYVTWQSAGLELGGLLGVVDGGVDGGVEGVDDGVEDGVDDGVVDGVELGDVEGGGPPPLVISA
jgi:hypothetical protein